MATSIPPAPPAPGQLPRPSLSQTVDVETPELVVLSYTVAGVGSRATAAFIDYAICIATLDCYDFAGSFSDSRRALR